METHTWKNLGLERRKPTVADVTIAAVIWYLLHVEPQVPEVIAAAAAVLALRCFRVNDPARKRR
ncbi:hypothetical protein ACF09Y_13815 [Streptomyces massasporeus]|uniref:hypothetical protein n=1 Tax=Streptomyces massasporeus TaxID=67324 RepID=UPI0036FA2DE4